MREPMSEGEGLWMLTGFGNKRLGSLQGAHAGTLRSARMRASVKAHGLNGEN